MRHRVSKRHFNRDTNHRKALLMNLVRFLMERGSIKTSEAKAKETKRLADKLISKAAKGDISSRRILHSFFGKRDVVNTMVDKIAPAAKDRKSGFTTLTKLGKRRGDNTEVVKLSLVDMPEKIGTLKSDKKYENKKKLVKPAVTKVGEKKTIKKNIKS